MSELIARYQKTLSNINTTTQVLHTPQAVMLLAVSKTKPASMIRELHDAGQQNFGENYLQEALSKQVELEDIAVTWHYIGSIQRNKTKDIANHFDWVHTVERTIIAKRLAEQRDKTLPRLNVCIQVNIDQEATKSGCSPHETKQLVEDICDYQGLNIRGLMVIPSTEHVQAFARTQALFDDISHTLSKQLANHDWDTLSMGMSGDYEQALAHGATIIRVGSAIFGSRS